MTTATLLGVRAAAQRLDVHENTVRNWVADGRIRPAMRVGRRSYYRFHEAEVERVRAERAIQSVEEAQAGFEAAREKLADALTKAAAVLWTNDGD